MFGKIIFLTVIASAAMTMAEVAPVRTADKPGFETVKIRDAAAVGRGGGTERCIPNVIPNSGGQIDGFKCFGIGNVGGLARAGLIEGDIVVSVDGEILRSPVQAMDLISRIQDDQFVEVRVSRNGQSEILRPRKIK